MRLIEFPPVATLKQWAVKYDRATNDLRQRVFMLMKSSAYDGASQMTLGVEGRIPAVDTVIRELREQGYTADYGTNTVKVTLEIAWR